MAPRPFNQKRIHWLCVLLSFIGVLASSLGLYVGTQGIGSVQLEDFYHLFGWKSPRELENRRDIGRVREYLGRLELHNYEVGNAPEGKEFHELPEEFTEVFYRDVLREYSGWHGAMPANILSGYDRFGTPLIYQRRIIKETPGMLYFSVTIRSAGANRRDEGGGGDDVQQQIDLAIERAVDQ